MHQTDVVTWHDEGAEKAAILMRYECAEGTYLSIAPPDFRTQANAQCELSGGGKRHTHTAHAESTLHSLLSKERTFGTHFFELVLPPPDKARLNQHAKVGGYREQCAFGTPHGKP